MPLGIPRSRLTSDRRERYEKLRLEKALITLFRARDDLNPEQFTRAEFLAEFDTNLLKGENSELAKNVDFDADVALLIQAGYVEKLHKGYRVTDAGMEVEES